MSEQDQPRNQSSWRDGSDITADSPDVGETRVQDPVQFDMQPRTPLLWLVVARPLDQRGTILAVQPGQLIGRKGEIHWRDPRMSRLHARFTLEDDPANPGRQIYLVAPQQDRNGTFVNGERITHPTPLVENDQVQMGDTVFVVKTLD